MSKIAETRPVSGLTDEADHESEDDFQPLTREQAQAWRERQPKQSPWSVLRWQVALACVVAVVAGLFGGTSAVIASALYGAAVGIVPAAVMAWGVTSSLWARRAAGVAQATLAGFFLWEGVKLLLAMAMLWSAPRLVADLSWLALVAGLVVVLKAYWLELWFRTRRQQTKQ